MDNSPYKLLTLITDDEDWREKAECRKHDPEMWFKLHGTIKHEQAKNICGDCPVRTQCLEWALTLEPQDDHGILGGLNESERRRIRKMTA